MEKILDGSVITNSVNNMASFEIDISLINEIKSPPMVVYKNSYHSSVRSQPITHYRPKPHKKNHGIILNESQVFS